MEENLYTDFEIGTLKLLGLSFKYQNCKELQDYKIWKGDRSPGGKKRTHLNIAKGLL